MHIRDPCRSNVTTGLHHDAAVLQQPCNCGDRTPRHQKLHNHSTLAIVQPATTKRRAAHAAPGALQPARWHAHACCNTAAPSLPTHTMQPLQRRFPANATTCCAIVASQCIADTRANNARVTRAANAGIAAATTSAASQPPLLARNLKETDKNIKLCKLLGLLTPTTHNMLAHLLVSPPR